MKALKAVATILLLASAQFCSSTPAYAAAPPTTAPTKECDKVLVVRDGKVFAIDTTLAPGFDPKTAPTEPWCDGDLYPTPDAEALIEDSKRLPIELERLEIEKRGRSNDRASFDNALRECSQRESAERVGRLACERDKAPPPKPVKRPAKAYEKAALWVGAAILTTVVVVGVATGEDHPLLWAAGGVGIGIGIGGIM